MPIIKCSKFCFCFFVDNFAQVQFNKMSTLTAPSMSHPRPSHVYLLPDPQIAQQLSLAYPSNVTLHPPLLLAQFQLYVVEQWLRDRNRDFAVIVAQTIDKSHKV